MARLRELQALRGLAILLVCAYHFTVRWSSATNNGQSLYPYGDFFAPAEWLLAKGFFGVPLFFMISGFVISLTLTRSDSIVDFWIRRVARLWPPLLMCLLVVALVLSFSPDLPGASPSWSDYLSSITLINPGILDAIFTWHTFGQTTGVLWTLWIELLFYALAACLFFSRGPFLGKLLISALALSPISVLAHTRFWLLIPTDWNLDLYLGPVLDLGRWIWWFVAGCAIYKMRSKQIDKKYSVIFVSSFVFSSGASFNPNLAEYAGILAANILIFILFALVANPRSGRMLQNKFFEWIGEISYEFYLVHEAIGLSVLQLIKQNGNLNSPLLILLPTLLCIYLAHLIYGLWSRQACAWTRTTLSHVRDRA